MTFEAVRGGATEVSVDPASMAATPGAAQSSLPSTLSRFAEIVEMKYGPTFYTVNESREMRAAALERPPLTTVPLQFDD